MAKAIVRLDKVAAVKSGNIVSVKAPFDLENGMLLALNGLETGHRDLFKCKAFEDVLPNEDTFVIHATPELNYNEGLYILPDGTTFGEYPLSEFYVPEGKVARAYHLIVGDIVTVADSLISGATTVGQFVVPSNSGKTLKAVSSFTDEKLVFKVIEKTTLGGGRLGYVPTQASSVLMVIKAN